jgi:hypothetical protein
MAKMTIKKTAFAMAAAVVALAVSGTDAKANSYTFDYTLTSIAGGTPVTLLLTATDMGVANGPFEEYQITSLQGTGTYAGLLKLLTPAQAGSIVPPGSPFNAGLGGTYNFLTDNILYVDKPANAYALDQFGFAFSSGAGLFGTPTGPTSFYDVYFNNFSNTAYFDQYVQSVDIAPGGGSNGVIPEFTEDASIAYTISQVPTPTSLALLGAGLLGLGVFSLRKKLI